MNRTVKILFIFTAIAVLCSCGNEQIGNTSPVASYKVNISSQSQNIAEEETAPEEVSISEILCNFNWMGDDGYSENSFVDKPFLQINSEGGNGVAGVLDINRDGEQEFLLAVYHPPRGIASVEVFALKNNHLQSIGGFFENRDKPHKLSYYRDEQDRLLFLQETESHYGGIHKTLVATYTDNLRNVPIAGLSRYYYEDEGFPNRYYVFPKDENIECTNLLLCGIFSNNESQYDATEEEYNAKILEFMDTLTWVEDVEYDYAIYYQLYNYPDLTNEIRREEIHDGLKTSPPKNFRTSEELKKTSDMVADALYAAYMTDAHQ